MKKIMSVGIAVVLLAVSALPALAAAETEIRTVGEVAYELSLPADVQIPWESETYDIGAVKAEKMNIEPNKAVKVSVSSENGFNLVNDGDKSCKIAYTLSGHQAISFAPGSIGTSFPLSVAISDAQWSQAASGEHRDILTFTVEYTQA